MRARSKNKISKNGLTASTQRFYSYPGDSSVRVQVVDERGVHVLFFNIWPRTYKKMRYWDNDRYGRNFGSITEAKEWALRRALDARAESKKKKR